MGNLFTYLDATDKNERYSNATVTKEEYDKCNLFIKYKHQPNSTLTTKDIDIYKNNSRKEYVTFKMGGDYSFQLQHEDVYFNKYFGNEFLVLVLYFSGQKIRYITHSKFNEHKNSSLNISELEQYNELLFIDVLIKENDKINDSVTFRIDKKTDKYNSKISLQSDQKNLSHGFTKYTHNSTQNTKNSFILYNYQPLNDKGQKPIIDIQNQKYTSVEVYFSNKFIHPVLVCLIGVNKACYVYKTSDGTEYFEKTDIEYEELTKYQNQLIETLKETEFTLLNSVQLLIDYKLTYRKDQLQTKTGKEPTGAQPGTIEVSENKNCTSLKQTNYKLFEHNLSNIQVKQGTSVRLKLFISNGTFYNEIELYDGKGTSETDRTHIDYNNDTDKLQVYFYGSVDPRPLLLCYKNAYKPASLNDYTDKWVRVDGIRSEMCRRDNPTFKNELKNVVNMLNPVKLEQPRPYEIHEQGEYSQIKINVINEDEKCYKKYTHRTNTGYKLGRIVYNKDGTCHDTSINETDEKNSVVVYYYKKDDDNKYPLLTEIQLKSSNKSKVYYKLRDKDKYIFEIVPQENLSGSKLLDELFTLNQHFNSVNPSEESECKDLKDNTPLIAGVAVPAVVFSGGGAITAYVFRGSISACLRSTF